MAEGQQQQQGGDHSLGPLWIAIALFVAIIVMWYYCHTYIAGFIIKVKIVEAYCLYFFDPEYLKLVAKLKQLDPSSVSYQDFQEICDLYGNAKYLGYPLGGILFLLGVVTYFGSSPTQYRTTYSMKNLLLKESVNWPQINPVLKLDLINEDLNKGPWAMCTSPMQFAKKYQLLYLEKIIYSDQLASKAKITATVLKDKAAKIFALQVGRIWNGVEKLPIYQRALFAVFAARSNHDVAAATFLLNQIGVSAGKGELDFSGTDALLNKYKDTKSVQKVVQSHAYILTVMASMLLLARKDGVLAVADFIWLKPLDRPLWYMLSNVGRQTAFTEIGGPFAHWLAEREVGRKIYIPMIDAAVNGLEEAIKEIQYVAEEDAS